MKTESIIWASGELLTEPLPSDYVKWTLKQVHSFCENNAWMPLAEYSGIVIWLWINSLAESMEKHNETN